MERAFELARGGTCRTMDDLIRALKAEGYSGADMHLSGPSLKKQLRSELAKASG
jgi:hypothetical protein